MVRVNNLTKRFAGRTAIDGLSFSVQKGEIVGFLGPNGAGKTTTLRILTNFIPPTSGRASIGGHDLFKESLKARKITGYMPENVPLYNDMKVNEYLRFRGALQGLRGKRLRTRLGEVIELCGLTEVKKSLINHLSKGFRQRVGLADALIHEPELLILDEPTNGLDPNQIRQARELIRDLGEKHTILISTHILPEVEMTCGRVIIINKGKIRAADTPANLVQRHQSASDLRAEVKGPRGEVLTALRELKGVKGVEASNGASDWLRISLSAKPNTDIREDLFTMVRDKKWALRELRKKTASLEDVFVALTHGDQ